MIVKSAEELQQLPEYKEVLLDLLLQLGDDDFILSFRGSEWLGLCPHIEEDVAYSSITQNTMGHATMYYKLIEEIGEGSADELAHARTEGQRKNAIILEEANGEGSYLDEPKYDWAFAVVRNYLYEVAKKIRLDSLKQSSYVPLANVARSVSREQYYHIKHWEIWFKQLLTSTPEARGKMETQIERIWKDFGGVLSLGPNADKMKDLQLIAGEKELSEKWLAMIESAFEEVGLQLPTSNPGLEAGNGREGTHTEHLTTALATLSEVYNMDRAAAW
ncbi:1,2-phenylacetyl-CoA epoxidase subunit PaaC [Halalkalibacterium ligniniphilum]|uniref:1,2-phenylacetyl-CoA epoxidase subunit PaaC n=1 Tax=Halalkalibacterium ligniniphilum TaxID=1134413 RepID=UPI00034BA39D|nr:1,2-phenylacetyl-CoA epoxidase subunit PaaC [Halalkalibacterium ligniniphilum]